MPPDRGSRHIRMRAAGVNLYGRAMASVKQVQVTFDYEDPQRLARFVAQERLAVLEAECARLVALGARRGQLLPADDDNESCLVMQDIEGNESDLD